MPALIYLDHHATTPCDPRVVEAMLPWFTERFGNASSRSHVLGLQAHAATERAREQVAALIGASRSEIVWTSGATESDNLAIFGGARAQRERGRHVVTTAIEHKAVVDPCHALEGFEVTVVPVDAEGIIRVADVEAALRPDTVLVSVMAANNEIGTLQPIEAVGALCRARGIVFHVDAAQAAGRIPIDVGRITCDLLSLSAHKMYGPKGVGVLFVRRGRSPVTIEPLLLGGGQERGLRPGTLPVPLIVGMGVAAELAAADLASDAIGETRRLRDRLWAGIRSTMPGARLNGSWEHRLPNNLNFSFSEIDAETLMMSMKEVAFSSGSACTSASPEPSHVIRALYGDSSAAHSSIRFGLGRFNTEAEIDRVVELLRVRVPELRAANPVVRTPDVRTVHWTPTE